MASYSALRRTRRKAENILKRQARPDVRPAEPGLVNGAFDQGFPVFPRIIKQRPGGNPVRRDGQAADNPLQTALQLRPVRPAPQQAPADLTSQRLPGRPSGLRRIVRKRLERPAVMRPGNARHGCGRAQSGKAGPAYGPVPAHARFPRQIRLCQRGSRQRRVRPPVRDCVVQAFLKRKARLAHVMQQRGQLRPRRQQPRHNGVQARAQAGGNGPGNAAMRQCSSTVRPASVRCGNSHVLARQRSGGSAAAPPAEADERAGIFIVHI